MWIRVAAPILPAALGAAACNKAGVVNLGLEGIMLVSALVFAFFDGLSNILQALQIPSQFVQMLPYLAAIAGLTAFSIQQSARAKRRMKQM